MFTSQISEKILTVSTTGVCTIKFEDCLNFHFSWANRAFLDLFHIQGNDNDFQNTLKPLLHSNISLHFTWSDFIKKVIDTGTEQEISFFCQKLTKQILLKAFLCDEQTVSLFALQLPDVAPDANLILEREQLFHEQLNKLKTISIQGYKEDGTVVFWNRGSELLYGYSENEALGRNLLDLIIPDKMRNEVKKAVTEMVRTGKGIPPAEIYLKHKSGKLVPVFSSHIVFSINNLGKVLYCVDIDLSQIKATEKKLKKLSLATEQSPASIIVTDVLGNIEFVNPKFCQLTGYQANEVTGHNPSILKSGLTPPETYDQLWRTIKAGDEWHGEFINRKKNGDIYYESAVISPIIDPDGTITHFVAVKEDITGRILAQRETMKYNNNLATLLEISQSFIATLDMDDLLQTILNSGLDLLNLDCGAIYFKDDGILQLKTTIPPLNDASNPIATTANPEDHPHINDCINKKQPIVIHDALSAVLSESEREILQARGLKTVLFLPLITKKSVIGIITLGSTQKTRSFSETDITLCQTMATQAALAIQNASLYLRSEQNAYDLAYQNFQLENLNNELKIAKERSEESDRLKTAFLQNMSHEIRTPMNGIIGFGELLKTKDLSSRQQSNYVDHINKCTFQLLSIVEDIIDVSRLEAGDFDLRPQHNNLTSILEEVKTQFESEVSHSVELQASAPTFDSPTTFYIDAEKIKQVLEKLVSNAVKFTHCGHIRFGYNVEQEALNFFVEDTGIGIEKTYQSDIFKPFYQTDMADSRNYNGNGLGLTIASRIVEKMGSVINLESEPGKGSLFSFKIVPETEDNVNRMLSDYSRNVIGSREFTILVAVNDDVNYILIHDTILDSIKNADIRVIRAKNGIEAIEASRSELFVDIILMDIKMPVMNGIEATHIIKAENADVQIIGLTSVTNNGEQEKSIAAGCVDSLHKPLNPEILIQTVTKHLRIAHP